MGITTNYTQTNTPNNESDDIAVGERISAVNCLY